VNLGIDIGATFIKFYSSKEKGKVKTPGRKKDLVETVSSIVKAFNPEVLGVAVAGLVTYPEGRVVESPNIQFINGLNLKGELEEITGKPVVVVNDATAAAYGEYVKAGRGEKCFICLTLGTGLGGGAVIDGKPLLGEMGVSMEIGHTTICINGWPCHCGRRGCLEAYASSYGLERHYFMITGKMKSSFQIVKSALEGEREAEEALKKLSFYLGIGVKNLIHTFNPGALVIGGGIASHYPGLIEEVKRVVEKMAFSSSLQKLQIKPAGLGEFSGAVGAFLMAERFLKLNLEGENAKST